jgi:hypothetical protein
MMTIQGGRRAIVAERNADAPASAPLNAAPLSRCAELVDHLAAEADREGAARAAAILRAVAGMLRADVAAPQR